MTEDLWHFPRKQLAEQVLSLFSSNLSSVLIFFAPRRMGKTEFLNKDILPLARKKNWYPFYFSFLDAGENIQEEFVSALQEFAEKIGAIKTKKFSSRIQKISGEISGIGAGSIELRKPAVISQNLKTIFSDLAKHGNILLLMDEVQVLAKNPINKRFIASLRTALDLYKDNVKVIFTGSSREGLRLMFSQATAPFFHFGQNLPFPELGQEFTDHLAEVFKKITQRALDKKNLWEIFTEIEKVPQLIRSLVERLVLNPTQSIDQVKKLMLADIFNDRAYVEIWETASKLEQLLLREIANGSEAVFSQEFRSILAKKLGITELGVPTVQSAMRALQRRQLIGKISERSGYYIEDPNFKNWLQNLNN